MYSIKPRRRSNGARKESDVITDGVIGYGTLVDIEHISPLLAICIDKRRCLDACLLSILPCFSIAPFRFSFFFVDLAKGLPLAYLFCVDIYCLNKVKKKEKPVKMYIEKKKLKGYFYLFISCCR